MKYYQIVILVGVVLGASQLTVNPNQPCSCTQLLNEIDCKLNAFDECNWYNGACSQTPCSGAEDCKALSGRCYRTVLTNEVASCNPYTKCSELKGTTVQACQTQTTSCTWVQGATTCSEKKIVNCSDLAADKCQQGDDGICFLNNNKCQLAKCANMTKNQCEFVGVNACYWNTASSQCVASQCSNITTPKDCLYVLSEYKSNSGQVCQWDQATNTCGIVAKATDLQTPQTCYLNSAGTYTWNNADTVKGTCVKCHGSIISIVGALIGFFILN